MKRRRLLPLLLCAATLPLHAQQIWRCGVDARSYSAGPCPDGRAVVLAEAPSAAAVAEARAVVARERLALKTLAAERRARERDAVERGLGPAGITTARAPAAPAKPGKPGKKKPPPA